MKKLLLASIIAIGTIIPSPAIASQQCHHPRDIVLQSNDNVSFCKDSSIRASGNTIYTINFKSGKSLMFINKPGTKTHGVYFVNFETETSLFIDDRKLISSENYNNDLVDNYRDLIKVTLDYVERNNVSVTDF
jgi:hypothetical protein